MINAEIYTDIAKRTNGELFVGVVGPVRTGKSTFIKRFAEQMMLPHIENEYDAQRTRDELPQSAAGRTVMTAEPKFIPDEAVEVSFGDSAKLKMRLVDCVGYLVPGAAGHTENGEPRMVHTPWQTEPMPFEAAAEEGTRRVIREHSTVAMLVTTDGSFGELPREAFAEAEVRIASELAGLGKPFCVILNSADPESDEAGQLAVKLEKQYGAPVALVDCSALDAEDIDHILYMLLDEFPVKELTVSLPGWMRYLPDGHPLVSSFLDTIRTCAEEIGRMGDIKTVMDHAKMNPDIADSRIDRIDYASGCAKVALQPDGSSYYTAIRELTGLEIAGDEELFPMICELATIKKQYDQVADALREVNEKGYGIVMPDISELKLEEPEIVRQAGGYGVRLRASARSVHMIKANIETEINPIVGTEQQSEELIGYLTKEFSENPTKIWDTNLLGKSLYDLVNDGLRAKLQNMPDESRAKLSDTLERIINEGSGGLICIIL